MKRFKNLGRDSGSGTPPRRCDHEGCDGAGEFRAPRGRDALRTYYWFCLDHIREYNKAWNYFAGMSREEVEHYVREDVVGWRPTWPIGLRQRFGRGPRFYDPFGFFAAEGKRGRTEEKTETASEDDYVPNTREGKALALLNLRPPITLSAIKRRYKELVKRHHPDANNGDKSAEEKLKLINEAYGILKRLFASSPSP